MICSKAGSMAQQTFSYQADWGAYSVALDYGNVLACEVECYEKYS